MLAIRFVTELTILAILSLVAILFCGCMAGMGYSARDRVTTATQEYNEGVRWGRLDQAGAHIQKARSASALLRAPQGRRG